MTNKITMELVGQVLFCFALVAWLGGCVTEVKKKESSIKLDPEYDPGSEAKTDTEIERQLLAEYTKNPDKPAPAWRIGEYYLAKNQYVKAEHWFRYSMKKIDKIDTYPNSFYLYFKLGQACLWQSHKNEAKVKEAKRNFEKVLIFKDKVKVPVVEYKEFQKAHFYLGMIYQTGGDKKSAQRHFEKYVSLGGSAKRVKRVQKRMEISKNYQN